MAINTRSGKVLLGPSLVKVVNNEMIEEHVELEKGYSKISIAPKDQEKTTFTCPYGFSFKQMSFGLCNTPATFRRRALQCYEQFTLIPNWEKFHFIVREVIVLGHKILAKGIEVDKAKVKCLKLKLEEAPIVVAPEWTKPFETMCDASGVALGAVLGQKKEKLFHPIYNVRKALIGAIKNYTVMKQELLAVVYAFEKFMVY
ncbi:uncharacterized protein LOC124887788 [Capsicum annuum]|uniref:uncharacterized protein LOC124887788 n=1 Tax=Capsicum annuum TaxID=4072 RepID=UPI001FB15B61|nr:uncharacterized protein LOC124887788 [Capsicum annuum]